MIKYYYLGAAAGKGTSVSNSFDNALLNAGMGNYNLLKVSSILPSGCSISEGIHISEGEPVYTAYATITAKKQNCKISAAIGIGIPKEKEKVGVIMEYSGYCGENYAKNQVEKMVVEAMKARNYEIAEIKTICSESTATPLVYTTAFAGIAMW